MACALRRQGGESMRYSMIAAAGLLLVSCAGQSAVQPDALAPGAASMSPAAAAAGGSRMGPTGKPGYEPAYFNDRTVTINAIEVPQKSGPLTNASADFYQVVYP